MHEDVRAQRLCDCELDELLEQPPSDRATAGLHPDVRAEPDPQRVDATQPKREHVLFRHDVCSVILERAKQAEVAAVDDDPVLERRRARPQASIEERAPLKFHSVARRNKCNRCGQVSIPSSDGVLMRGRHSLLGTPARASPDNGAALLPQSSAGPVSFIRPRIHRAPHRCGVQPCYGTT